MADFYIAQGDTASFVPDTLRDSAGDAVDIAGASITFQMIGLQDASFRIDADAENDQTGTPGPDNETQGNVHYEWATGQTDDPGYFLARWVVTFGDGSIQTYPNDGWFTISISPDVPGSSATLATTEDLQVRVGLEFTAAEHVRASRLLAVASNMIRRETGQFISLVADDVLTWRGTAGNVMLPERPVVEVSSVSLDGTALDASGYYLAGDVLIRGGTYQGWPSLGYGFGDASQVLEVVYTHGYDEVPGDVVAVCLEVVARVWTNPGAVVASSIGQVQTTYSVQPVSGMLLTDVERATLARALSQGVGSVQLR